MDKYYDTIVELPLSKFKIVAVKNDLTALIISGQPTPLQLAEAWKNIQQEYSDAIGNMESLVLMNLQRNLTILQMNFTLVQGVINVLQNFPFFLVDTWELEEKEEIRESLRHFTDGLNRILITSFDFNFERPEEFQRELKNCISVNKKFKMKYERKQEEIEAMNKKSEGQQVSFEYFEKMLIILGDHKNIVLTDSISVFQYCERIRRYLKDMEQPQPQKAR